MDIILRNKQITFVLISPTRSTEMLSNHFLFFLSNLHQIFLHPTTCIMKCLALFKSNLCSCFLYKIIQIKEIVPLSLQYAVQNAIYTPLQNKCYLDRLAFYIIRRDLNGGGQFLMATEQCRFLNRTMSHSELHVSKKYKTGLMENPDQF